MEGNAMKILGKISKYPRIILCMTLRWRMAARWTRFIFIHNRVVTQADQQQQSQHILSNPHQPHFNPFTIVYSHGEWQHWYHSLKRLPFFLYWYNIYRSGAFPNHKSLDILTISIVKINRSEQYWNYRPALLRERQPAWKRNSYKRDNNYKRNETHRNTSTGKQKKYYRIQIETQIKHHTRLDPFTTPSQKQKRN